MSINRWQRLPRSDRRGLAFLLIVAVVVAIILFCVPQWRESQTVPLLTEEEIRELGEFEQALREDSVKRAMRYSHNAAENRTPELFHFNPNTADSATLLRLGLRPWQVRNMLKYRRKGGRWRSPDDFARLYGLSHEDFLRLRPYVQISPEEAQPLRENERGKERPDSFVRKYPEKFPVGTVLNLNTADTTQLKGIPGIGSYYAGKICRYRERLGGFVRVEQIKEVEGLPEGIEAWFEVAADARPQQINVNTADFQTLVRHPYLSYEQVKVITAHRQKYGKLQGWEDVRLHELFQGMDFDRLEPYFSFR